MNSEAQLFNHNDFGEAYIGMSLHTATMTQSERMIHEDCVLSGDAVLAPHANVKSGCKSHLRPELIAKRTGCTFAQAVQLCNAWCIIEATSKMVDTFILWIKVKGAAQAVTYFEKLACQLAEVEGGCEEFESMGDESDPEEGDVIPETVGFHPIGCTINTVAYCDVCEAPNDVSQAFGEDDEATIYCKHCDNSFKAYKYAWEKPWESAQPKAYRSLLNKLRYCEKLDVLCAIGKAIHENKPLTKEQGGTLWFEYQKARKMTKGQAGVFWHEYNKAKARLTGDVFHNLGETAKTIMHLITATAVKDLGRIGTMMHKVQTGKAFMTNPPSKEEWGILWAAYKARKPNHEAVSQADAPQAIGQAAVAIEILEPYPPPSRLTQLPQATVKQVIILRKRPKLQDLAATFNLAHRVR